MPSLSVVVEARPPPLQIERASQPVLTGCAFRDRCAHAVAVCATTVPPLEEVVAGHWAACHRARELAP
jgi:oligopeptide/dipeptide ABC transporter ATP-binding protein